MINLPESAVSKLNEKNIYVVGQLIQLYESEFRNLMDDDGVVEAVKESLKLIGLCFELNLDRDAKIQVTAAYKDSRGIAKDESRFNSEVSISLKKAIQDNNNKLLRSIVDNPSISVNTLLRSLHEIYPTLSSEVGQIAIVPYKNLLRRIVFVDDLRDSNVTLNKNQLSLLDNMHKQNESAIRKLIVTMPTYDVITTLMEAVILGTETDAAIEEFLKIRRTPTLVAKFGPPGINFIGSQLTVFSDLLKMSGVFQLKSRLIMTIKIFLEITRTNRPANRDVYF